MHTTMLCVYVRDLVFVLRIRRRLSIRMLLYHTAGRKHLPHKVDTCSFESLHLLEGILDTRPFSRHSQTRAYELAILLAQIPGKVLSTIHFLSRNARKYHQCGNVKPWSAYEIAYWTVSILSAALEIFYAGVGKRAKREAMPMSRGSRSCVPGISSPGG